MCGLLLAWVTSENSTKLLESDTSWLTVSGPYLLCYCLRSPVLTAPVRGSTPTLCCSPLCCPTLTALVRVPRQPHLCYPAPNALVRVPRQLPLCYPAPTALVRVPRQLPLSSFVQPTLIRVPFPLPDTARFHVQNPLSGFEPKQTKESSALAAHPHSATYRPPLPLSFIDNKLQQNSTTSKKAKTFIVSNNRNYKILKGFGRPLKKIINDITT